MNALGPMADRPAVFQVGPVVYDQSTLELYVDGQRRPVEAKPRALLQALLVHAGALVTKRALIEAVWGNAEHITDTSLTTAMSKLRAALGSNGRGVIDVVHGMGYRINGAVTVTPARSAAQPAFTFAVDDPVPGRPQWRLQKLLGSSLLNDVWLARQVETLEAHVVKFARTERRLETLKRQASAARALQAALGPRDDLIPILEWDFDQPPFFIESLYGGDDLLSWTAAQGGLDAIPLALRLAMVANIADIVAAAHGAGVVHGGLKPANILVGAMRGGAVCLRVADFGAGGLTDMVRLETLGITLDDLDDGNSDRIGTLGYIAPEVLTGQAPTQGADVYALGVLLYQMAAGDFAKPLGVGWEDGIGDELLRRDIAEAAAGDPVRRMASAALLAERLGTLPARRAALQQYRQDEARMADLARQVERERLRRPWRIAAAALMIVAMTTVTWFGLRAARDRDQARQHAALMQAVNAFLTEDLLGRGDPARSGKPDETLMQAAQASEDSIDGRFGAEPLEAGALYMSLAHAYESRSAYDDARRAYTRATAWFGRAGAAAAAQTAGAELKQAGMEAASGQAGSLARAVALVDDATPRVGRLGATRAGTEIWLFRARALIDTAKEDQLGAQENLRHAVGLADATPEAIDESERLALLLDLSATFIHLAKWDSAQDLLSRVLQRELVLHGPGHAETLRVELRSAEVRVAQGDLDRALSDLDRLGPQIGRVFGPDHRVTLTLLAMRADVLTRLGRFDEAQSAESAIYARVVRLDGARSWTALGTLTNTAQTRCRAARVAAGLAAGEAAYAGAREAFGDRHTLTQAAAGNLAFCLTVDHQYSRALDMIQHIDIKTVGEATRDQDYRAEIDLMRADIAFATGNPVLGSALTRKTAPVFERAGADRYLQDWARRLSKLVVPDR